MSDELESKDELLLEEDEELMSDFKDLFPEDEEESGESADNPQESNDDDGLDELDAFLDDFEKNLDIIAGNIVGRTDSGFATDTNTITLFYKDGTREPLPAMEKDAAAHVLLDRIVDRFTHNP